MYGVPTPAEQAAAIALHLRARGATAVCTVGDGVKIVGRAPSGALIELYERPGHGYHIRRRGTPTGVTEYLGPFVSWKEAAASALRA